MNILGHNQRREIKPLMAFDHRTCILDMLTLSEGKRLLEWGAGGSTIFFLRNLPANAKYVSIEHSKRWADLVSANIIRKDMLDLRHIPATGHVGLNATKEEEDPTHLHDYIHGADGEVFDIILVDGVARGACLQQALTLLAPSGRIFLHDAQRDWYDEGKKGYKKAFEYPSCPDYPGPTLWCGEHLEASVALKGRKLVTPLTGAARALKSSSRV